MTTPTPSISLAERRPVAWRLIACCLALIAAMGVPMDAGEAAAPPLPQAPAGQVECHGTIAGERFWLRLLPPDQQFGGHRVLQLLYTPPKPEALDGAHLVDCPFVLVDGHLRVVAWNGRDGLSQVVPAAKPPGYQITREITACAGADAHPAGDQRAIAGERGWDLHIAPFLLACAWRRDSAARARVVDLFGPRHGEALAIAWTGPSATIAGEAWTATADDRGRLQSLADQTGRTVLTVAAWVEPPAP